MSKKNFLPVALSVILLLYGCKRKSIYEQIEQEAIRYTQEQCPKQVDRCTRMDSTTFNTITYTYYYNYTVTDMLDNDSIFTGSTRQTLNNALLEEIRTSIALKTYKDCGITLSYRYYSATSGELLAEFLFTKEDYE